MGESFLDELAGPIGRPRKCLFGVTIMLVEDSRSASEALRLMSIASSARLRRADTIEAALRHLSLYRPNVVMVDLGLPDGNGLDLIARIAQMEAPRPGIIALSGAERTEWQAKALAAGAGAILEKPINGVAAFQKAILTVLPDGADREMGIVPREVPPNLITDAATQDDLKAAQMLLDAAIDRGDPSAARYCAQFLESIGGLIGDRELTSRAGAILRGELAPTAASAELRQLVGNRLAR